MSKVIYKRDTSSTSNEMGHPFHGFSAFQGRRLYGSTPAYYAGVTGAVIALSSLPQSELHTAAKTFNLAASDFANPIYGNVVGTQWDRYQYAIKSQVIYTRLKTVFNPLGIFILETATGYGVYTLTVSPKTTTVTIGGSEQGDLRNSSSMATFNASGAATLSTNVRIPFIGCDTALAKSFVAFTWTNMQPTASSTTAFRYCGYYTGTVSDQAGDGDLKLETANIVTNGAYAINKYTITDSIVYGE